MIRIFTDFHVPKYITGKWQWNSSEEKLYFDAINEDLIAKEEYKITGGFKFLSKMNQVQEMIFRQEFQRSDTTHDADFILVKDIINLVLFFSPTEFMNKNFIHFINTHVVDRLLRYLIIYFEYYLKMVEFLLIRRDEIAGDMAQIQSEESNEIKRIYASYLSQYRILIAREYSIILLGMGEAKPFYHITPIVNISQSIKDKHFHECFQAFATQVVWIAMHRRAYETIDSEMCRLFRSEHFKLTRNEKIKFQPIEASMLYGKNYRRINYRQQTSPLIQELANIETKDLPILWIGERKYRGNDLRIAQIELEYIVPDSQLSLIDVAHGILGHPKILYDTMLKIRWDAVRQQHYTKDYDPYFIIRQPHLVIPQLNEAKIRDQAKRFESYYQIFTRFEPMTKTIKQKWMKRDSLVQYYMTGGFITDVWKKCKKEIEDKSYGPSVEEITRKFIERKRKLRKK